MTFRVPSPEGTTMWTTTTMDKVLGEATPFGYVCIEAPSDVPSIPSGRVPGRLS
jgi:hypothetical protein